MLTFCCNNFTLQYHQYFIPFALFCSNKEQSYLTSQVCMAIGPKIEKLKLKETMATLALNQFIKGLNLRLDLSLMSVLKINA